MDTPSDYLTPDEVTDVEFRTRRRGLDSSAVEAHLRSVADSLRDLLSDNSALRDEVTALRADLDRAQASVETGPAPDPWASLDEVSVRNRLGAEASQIVGDARAEADAILAAADERAREVLAEAEAVYAERSASADAEVHATQESARERFRDEIAESEAESARLIEEARVVRSQILQDLARRRTLARRQIDQLRAGRERLIASYDTIRAVLDDLGAELHVSMAEARAAAESAGQNISETAIEDLEAEIETARLSGLLDTGPVPVVDEPAGDDDKSQPTAAEARGDQYVETDSTVTELFERMRSSQAQTPDDEAVDPESPPAPEGSPKNKSPRSKDSANQR